MKKMLFLSLALAGFASASTISESCGSNNYAAPNGQFLTGNLQANWTCAALGVGGGNIITQLQYFYSADYGQGISAPNSVTYTYNALTGTWAGGNTDQVSGNQNSNTNVPVQSQLLFGDGISTMVAAGQTNTTDLGVGTSNFAGSSVGSGNNVVIVGGVSTTTGQLYLQVTYSTPAPPSGVPEPATLGLMGSTLLGLGFLARRKK